MVHEHRKGTENWFQPGDWVRLVGAEDWGPGQVQSIIGTRVTVNFDDAGKQLIDTAHAALKAA